MISSLRWFKQGSSEKEQIEFSKEILASAHVLERLAEIIKDDIETSQRKMRDEANFSDASWSKYQAFLLGEQKTLYKILNLIELKEKKNG